MEALTPQITPFGRKLKAGGYQDSATPATAPSRFAQSRFGKSFGLGETARTVRFGDTTAFGDAENGSLSGDDRGRTPVAHEKSS